MREKISALMDGELDEEDAASVIRKFEATDSLRDQWAVYHLISDVLEHSEARPIDVSRRVSARLAAEPLTLATPGAPTVAVLRPKAKRRPVAYAAAASIAAVFAAGWMSLQTTQAPHQQQNLADAGPAPANAKPAIPAIPAIPVIPVVSPASAAPPVQINDYLLAHREFSPSTAMHGVAPYTRTVAQSREHFGR
jgi:sigma-E factor negative regulatory protein RseA